MRKVEKMTQQSSQGESTVKLPLFSRMTTLKPLPQQTADVTFALTTQIPEPTNGFGYVVQVIDRRSVQILAWISADLRVFPTDKPLDHVPDSLGDLHCDPWTDLPKMGAVRVQSSDGLNRAITIGEYQLGKGEWGTLRSCSVDLGPYGPSADTQSREYFPLGVLLAAAWLGACFLPRQSGVDIGVGAGRISEIFHDMLDQSLPDALDALIWRGTTRSGSTSPFERFAARQLIEAGAGQIRQIAADHELDMIRLDTTRMFWMRFDEDEIEGLQLDIVRAVEAAMNRLAFVDMAARQRDNDMGLVSTLTEQECYDAAQAALHDWFEHADFIRSRANADNPWQTVRTTTAARGGRWDIMTRFTSMCECLSLPFTLEYRCEVNPAFGEMAIVFSVPTVTMMPSSALVNGTWIDCKAQRPAHAASYALRLAGLLAQAAFASGLRVTSVDVTGRLGSLEGEPVLSLGLNRGVTQMGVVPGYINGQFDLPQDDDYPERILEKLRPARQSIQFGTDHGLQQVTALPAPHALTMMRVPVWQDDRPLPAELQTLLRADTVNELDVMHDDCMIKGNEIMHIAQDNNDSPMSAMMEIESAIMEIEASQPEHGTKLPLYCDRPLSRLLVSQIGGSASDRYYKVPDALFNGYSVLGQIERELGELDKAVAQSQQLIEYGKTDPRGYISLSLDYTEVSSDYAQSAQALKHALQFAVMPIDVGFIYYRLAYALWQIGETHAALACYAMVLAMPEGPFHANTREEVGTLLSEIGSEHIPDRAEAVTILNTQGIAVAPSNAVLDVLAQAAVQLVDAGIPRAADDAVWLLGIMQQSDVLRVMRGSLLYGTQPASELEP